MGQTQKELKQELKRVAFELDAQLDMIAQDILALDPWMRDQERAVMRELNEHLTVAMRKAIHLIDAIGDIPTLEE